MSTNTAVAIDVTIREIPSFRVVSTSRYVGHSRNTFQMTSLYSPQEDTTGKHLMRWADKAGIRKGIIPGIQGLALLHADWSNEEPEDLTFEDCLLLGQEIQDYDSLMSLIDAGGFDKEISLSVSHTPGGLYAVTRAIGPYSDLKAAYKALTHEWLPKSNYKYAGGPILELYINDDRTVPEEELITDVCCPIEP